MQKTIKVAIVGGGVAGVSMLYYLARKAAVRNKEEQFEIHLIDSPLINKASHMALGVASLMGAKKGHGIIGDYLVEGDKLLRKFYLDHPHAPVQAVTNYHICRDQKKEAGFKSRFPSSVQSQRVSDLKIEREKPFLFHKSDALIVDMEKWLMFLRKQSFQLSEAFAFNVIFHSLHIERIEKLSQGLQLICKDGESLTYDKVVLCTGAYGKLWPLIGSHEKRLSRDRMVTGCLVEFENVNWVDKSLVLSLDHHTLVYDHQSKKLILGTTSQVDNHFLAPRLDQLKLIYQKFKHFLAPDLILEDFSQGKIKTAPRHRGIRKEPFWGAIDDDGKIYAFEALFKSGLFFSFLGAKTLADKIIQE